MSEGSEFFFAATPGCDETVSFWGVPFRISHKDGMVRSIGYGQYTAGERCEALFVLGMTTEQPEGSEWWGQAERYYANEKRLFIGDRLGSIQVQYEGGTMDFIPVLFGVNAWPYELFNLLKENEKSLPTYSGPYPEPFQSNLHAKSLLDDALVLRDTGAEKAMKYILTIKTDNRCPVHKVVLVKDAFKDAGFTVSAITGLKATECLEEGWRTVDAKYFLQQKYYTAADRLARRLYQFRDEIPAQIPYDTPDGYAGPKVRFSGNAAAQIFTNVYAHNIQDICTNKVDETGKAHTSSALAPNFGCYVGFGTFMEHAASYDTHMWSRDIGRLLMEAAAAGEETRTRLAGELLGKYLHDPCVNPMLPPHWKRICNSSELGNEALENSLDGKENDGHGALMLFIYSLYARGIVDASWLAQNKQAIVEAAVFYFWQIDNPELSAFNRVLRSESEASSQALGAYDLFSNAVSYYALVAYGRLAEAMKDAKFAGKCQKYAEILLNGIVDVFVTDHPRYGKIFVDVIYDCWTWEYKRFALVFLQPDITGFDPNQFDGNLLEIARHTWLAQKEDYYSPASGRQMGYGQGYLTQACLMLDEAEDYSACIEQAALFCYHHTDHNYIVPEGVIMHPSGRYWFRNCDLGNGVQQGEIVKCARLVLGLDDMNPENGLAIVPRLPIAWQTMEIEDYPVSAYAVGGRFRCKVNLNYERTKTGYRMQFSAERPLYVNYVRIGPFAPETEDVCMQGVQGKTLWKEIGGHRYLYLYFGGKAIDGFEILADRQSR
jgi:hypothetical protein